MSFSGDLSYAGICSRLRDGSSYFEVIAQLDSSGLQDLTGSSHNLFPPNGEVEWKSVARSYHPGDWAAFRVVPFGAPGQTTRYRATETRPLLPLEDLSHLKSAEAIRRLLVEDGREADAAGERFVRISDTEMVRISVTQSSSGKFRAGDVDQLGRLPVFRFEEGLCLQARDGRRPLVLVDPEGSIQQIGTLNWSSDAEFIRRIVKLLGRADAGQDLSLTQFAEALNRYADGLEGSESFRNAVDPLAAREALRVRNLAQVMRDQKDILASYFDALKSNAEVQQLVDARVSQIAQEYVLSEKARLLQELQKELQTTFAAIRAEREAELRKSIDELSNEMTADLEARALAQRNELDLQIAELERQGLDSLEKSLGLQKSALADAVSALELRKESALVELDHLERAKTEVRSSLLELNARESQALETIERLSGLSAKVGQAGGSNSLVVATLPDAADGVPPAPKIKLNGVKGAISEFPLLTQKGKSILLRFAVLLSAREVPLLYGPDCEDFLFIAETLLFGGRGSHLESDPTIVTFEDLWIRPGTHTATPLRLAIARALEGATRPQFCKIARADRSGARFWYPALVDRMQKGEIPKSVFLCATLDDKDSEETKCFSRGAIMLDLSGVIAQKAGVIAPGLLSGSKAKRFEIEPARDLSDNDTHAAVEFLAKSQVTVGVVDSGRICRILAMAKEALDATEAETVTREAAVSMTGAQAGPGPNLNLVVGGGPRV